MQDGACLLRMADICAFGMPRILLRIPVYIDIF